LNLLVCAEAVLFEKVEIKKNPGKKSNLSLETWLCVVYCIKTILGNNHGSEGSWKTSEGPGTVEKCTVV